MVFITEDTWKENGVEVITVDNVKWLNEKHIEKRFGHSNLAMMISKYSNYFKKEKKY